MYTVYHCFHQSVVPCCSPSYFIEKHCFIIILIEHCWLNVMYHWCTPPPLNIYPEGNTGYSFVYPSFICPFIHPFIHPFILFYPSIHIFIHSFIPPFIHLSILHPFHLSIRPSIHFFTHQLLLFIHFVFFSISTTTHISLISFLQCVSVCDDGTGYNSIIVGASDDFPNNFTLQWQPYPSDPFYIVQHRLQDSGSQFISSPIVS